MVSIVEELRRRGHKPTIIYNTNGYELASTLRLLESIVDKLATRLQILG